MEKEKQKSVPNTGSWGSHPTFMQFIQKMWKRLEGLRAQSQLTEHIKSGSRRIFRIVDPQLTFKQTSRIPGWGSGALMSDD